MAQAHVSAAHLPERPSTNHALESALKSGGQIDFSQESHTRVTEVGDGRKI
jgi:hypothetical protein